MHPLRVKICGVTTPEDVAICAAAGADAVGVNFHPGSKRNVDPRSAQPLLRSIPPLMAAVGVFVERPFRQVAAMAYQLGLRGVQLHGEPREIEDPFPFSVIAAFRVRDKTSLEEIETYLKKCVDAGRLPNALLVDAFVEGEHGGTGRTAPWELLANYRPSVPMILAGGLTPENVAEAIRVVRPDGVDVASGVESSPGRKDRDKVKAFIDRALARPPQSFEVIPMQTPNDESHYLHGTSPEEQDRLSKLNDMINGRSLAEMALRPGESVLDVGSGLGQLTRAMARQVNAKVVGIERSLAQIDQARQFAAQANESALVDFRQGDATGLPLRAEEWGTFDVAHTRFVLEHLRDPMSAVKQMICAVKPGGRIILEDDGHDTMRFYPESPGINRLWQSYIRTYDRVGNDPLIGHRLVSILHESGAMPVRNSWLFFGACGGQPELFKTCVENLISIIEGVREPILELGEVDASAFKQIVFAFREWGNRPDAAIWYAISWAEGKRPA